MYNEDSYPTISFFLVVVLNAVSCYLLLEVEDKPFHVGYVPTVYKQMLTKLDISHL